MHLSFFWSGSRVHFQFPWWTGTSRSFGVWVWAARGGRWFSCAWHTASTWMWFDYLNDSHPRVWCELLLALVALLVDLLELQRGLVLHRHPLLDFFLDHHLHFNPSAVRLSVDEFRVHQFHLTQVFHFFKAQRQKFGRFTLHQQPLSVLQETLTQVAEDYVFRSYYLYYISLYIHFVVFKINFIIYSLIQYFNY